jgi:hypothetical protein
VSVYCRETGGSQRDQPPVLASTSTEPLTLEHSERSSWLASGLSTPARWIIRAFARSWVLELGVFLVLAVAYNIVRAMPHVNAIDPYAHARAILHAEGAIFRNLEEPLNQWINTIPLIAIAACYFYAVLHYVATPTVFFLSRRQGGWQYWRGYWALILASGIALAIYALYPVAPPRLLPGLPIVDTMREFSHYGWWGSAASAPRGIGDATNQFAAMPSMHFGWALWCATQMWGFRTNLWRALALIYPTLLAIVVLATGNHFLLDVVGGAACVVVAYLVVHVLGRLLKAVRAQVATVEAILPMTPAGRP